MTYYRYIVMIRIFISHGQSADELRQGMVLLALVVRPLLGVNHIRTQDVSTIFLPGNVRVSTPVYTSMENIIRENSHVIYVEVVGK